VSGSNVSVATMGSIERDVASEVNLPEDVTPGDALAAVMCVLSRVSGQEAGGLASALPPAASALLKPCPQHPPDRPDEFGLDGFVERVAGHLQVSLEEAGAITWAVFAVVRRSLAREEIEDVASQLPPDLRNMWRGATASPAFIPDQQRTPLQRGPERGPAPASSGVPPERALAVDMMTEVRSSGTLAAGMTEVEAVRVVLCTLCARISRGEAEGLMLGLPPALRPLLEHCALDRAEPPEVFDRGELLARVAGELQVAPEQAEAIVRAVFTAAQRALRPKVIHDVASQLPLDLQDLWVGTTAAEERASPA
jgi:uncharacterized protein (DUF2267 family)